MAPGTMTLEMHASILLKLAEQVISARKLKESAEELVQKPLLLHKYVFQTSIDWRKIADELSEDRSRIYHWYRETHSRSILNVKMTSEDRKAIKEMIICAIKDRSILSPNFYNRVRERFGVKYPRQELRMTYNNALRTQDVRSALDECSIVLPRRTYNSRIRRLESETLKPSILPTGIVAQSPYMLNYAASPPMQAISAGGQVFMTPMSIMPAAQSVMPGFPPSNGQGYFVTGAPQSGAIAGAGSFPFQLIPSLAPMQMPQPAINPSISPPHAPLISPTTNGALGPYYGSLPPFRT